MNPSKWAKAYKVAYVVLIVANLAIVRARWKIDHAPYALAVAFLTANVGAWLGFSTGSDLGVVAEYTLSIGRMIAILACALPLWLTDVIVWVSPVAYSVWGPMLEFSYSPRRLMIKIITWRTSCAILMALECAYFYCLTRIDSKRGSQRPIVDSGDSVLM
jgi:hypothetical protein